MAFVKVLKYEGDNQTFVWKHPSKDFNTGSQLIVHESQEAVFYMDGKMLDVFSAGRYTLETANLPIISSVMKLATGGVSAFHCELYFVNKTEQMAIPWGTDSKIQYLDPIYNFPIQLGACGEMNLRVDNSGKLLVKVVGTENNLSQDALVGKIRAFIIKNVKTYIAKYIKENSVNVFDIDMHLSDISEYLEEKIDDELFDYGIKLVKFSVKTILLPEEDRDFVKFKQLHYRKVSELQEAELEQQIDVIRETTKAKKTLIEAEAIAKKRELEGYSYKDEKAFEVAKSVANNDAVGQMTNIGVGMGMIAGVGGGIGEKVSEIAGGVFHSQDNVNESGGQKRFCMNCGNPINPGAQFCEMCGTRVVQNVCSNCGNVMSENARFCPICGTKKG